MADKNRDPDNRTINKVGYGMPPEATRFKKGVSGNPKGRPKGSLNMATMLLKALREKIVIVEHGRRRSITKYEAALKQLSNKAVAGDLRALRQLTDLLRQAETQPDTATQQKESLSDLDQDVMQDILKRFSTNTNATDPQGGAQNDA